MIVGKLLSLALVIFIYLFLSLSPTILDGGGKFWSERIGAGTGPTVDERVSAVQHTLVTAT